MVHLGNGILSVEISPRGAEIQSVLLDGRERMWQADPAIWGKHAPLLFPIIGRLIGSEYTWEGETVSIPTHGFCRTRPFEIKAQTPDSVTFFTKEDGETQKVYPFRFTLEVTFRLAGNTIVKTHRVTNTGSRAMPFELGGHDAYATTLMPGETMADYAVAFEGLTELHPVVMDEKGILTDDKMTIPLTADGLLDKTPEEAGLDTIVLKDLPVRRASLVSRKSGRRVTVEFGDFPYLGIWTKACGRPTNYLCIEPWSALPDGYVFGRDLSEKPGIIVLQPGESRELSFSAAFC